MSVALGRQKEAIGVAARCVCNHLDGLWLEGLMLHREGVSRLLQGEGVPRLQHGERLARLLQGEGLPGLHQRLRQLLWRLLLHGDRRQRLCMLWRALRLLLWTGLHWLLDGPTGNRMLLMLGGQGCELRAYCGVRVLG